MPNVLLMSTSTMTCQVSLLSHPSTLSTPLPVFSLFPCFFPSFSLPLVSLTSPLCVSLVSSYLFFSSSVSLFLHLSFFLPLLLSSLFCLLSLAFSPILSDWTDSRQLIYQDDTISKVAVLLSISLTRSLSLARSPSLSLSLLVCSARVHLALTDGHRTSRGVQSSRGAFSLSGACPAVLHYALSEVSYLKKAQKSCAREAIFILQVCPSFVFLVGRS